MESVLTIRSIDAHSRSTLSKNLVAQLPGLQHFGRRAPANEPSLYLRLVSH